MDYQSFRPVTTSRRTNKQKTSNKNNFSAPNDNFFQKSKITKPPITNNQNQSQIKMYHNKLLNQYSLTINDQPRAALHRSKIYPIFQQN